MSVKHITKENFNEEVLQANQPVLIDFFATWCGPCKMVGPIIEQIAEEVSYAKVVKIDVDEQPELASTYGVMSIPTIMVMKDGKVVNKTVGFKAKNDIIKMLEH